MENIFLSPKEISNKTIEVGKKKANKSTKALILLGILAGAFISLGAIGAITMSALIHDKGIATLVAASVFPVGLMLVLIAGGELFTGNNLMTLGMLKGEYTAKDMLRNWGLVYIGNFIGALIMAILVYYSGLYTGAIGEKAVAIALKKVGLMEKIGWHGLMIRGILCNIVVVLAVWMSYGAKDITGKIFACWFPIMLFVLSGYEHSIANMFYLYIGKLLNNSIETMDIWLNNIIPVTIGNIVGGGLIIPIFYKMIFDDGKLSYKGENERFRKINL